MMSISFVFQRVPLNIWAVCHHLKLSVGSSRIRIRSQLILNSDATTGWCQDFLLILRYKPRLWWGEPVPGFGVLALALCGQGYDYWFRIPELIQSYPWVLARAPYSQNRSTIAWLRSNLHNQNRYWKRTTPLGEREILVRGAHPERDWKWVVCWRKLFINALQTVVWSTNVSAQRTKQLANQN